MNRRNGSPGFTLVELVVVLVIVALAVALVAPSLRSGLQRAGAGSTAKKVAAVMTHAREMALRNSETYTAETKDGGVVIKAEGSDTPAVELPPSAVAGVSGRWAVAFYPGGYSSGGRVSVTGLDDEPLYTVVVEPSTGRARVERTVER